MSYRRKMNQDSGKNAIHPNRKGILLALFLLAALVGIQAQASASDAMEHLTL